MSVKAGKFLTWPGEAIGFIVYADDELIANLRHRDYWSRAVSGVHKEARDFLEGYVRNYQRGGGINRPVPIVIVGRDGMDMDGAVIDPGSGRIVLRGLAYSLKV